VKAALHVNQHEHQQRYGAAMKAGLERHGIEVIVAAPHSPEPCDFAVIWGWKQPAVIKAAPHVLVMEATHLRQGDPQNLAEVSCGWDGLARHGRYPKAPDGERWQRHAHLMRPWSDKRDGYALIIGQVEGDAALHGMDVQLWADDMERALVDWGWSVRFRPHPLTRKSRTTLEQDLVGATLCVTFNSTAGVEAVLAGVPTVTLDPGAMAWPVARHCLYEQSFRPFQPDRRVWAWDLAWAQWSLEEIAKGEAYAHLAPIMEPA
jgi:hypothetical protein